MDVNQALKSAFDGAHMWYLGTIADVTAEQVNDVPPGLGTPSASTWPTSSNARISC